MAAFEHRRGRPAGDGGIRVRDQPGPKGARTIIRVAIVAVALSVAALMAPAAQAAQLEREHYSFTDSFTFDDCGFPIVDDIVAEGLFMLKKGTAGDPTPRYFDNYNVVETITNADTGEWFTITHQGLYKDLKITKVSGTIYQFTAIETGQPFVVRDSDGNVVLRDRGNLVRSFQVDTKGDSDLENDEFIEGSFSFIDHGAHPGFVTDFCDIATDLIG
jgi:hypothetical protein